MENLTGKLSVHPRGFGFVSVADKDHPDVFIPSSKLNGAIDRDTVEIKVISETRKGFDGSIVSVLEQGRKQIVGFVIDEKSDGNYMMFSTVVGEERDIILTKKDGLDLKIGDRILMKILDSGDKRLLCEFETFLGSMDNALVDTEIAIIESELREEFPKAVKEEVKAFPKELKPTKDRIDFTNLECITIDPIGAKDYDDAITCELDEKGHYHLGVHIADVSYFVTPGSRLDEEAMARANSTYFVDNVIPMLPSELSNELCSLKEKAIRYTASVTMEFSSSGKMISYKIQRGMIKSQKRLTYEDAKLILDGKKKSPHEKLLHLLVELCGHLKRARKERGSVELSMPDVRLKMGPEGIPIGQDTVEYDITHQLVEEFMLKANETVARHLSKLGKRLLFRIHDCPDPQTIDEFFKHASLLNYQLPPNPSDSDIQKLFENAKGTECINQLAVRYIRSMRLAIYSPENIGHYGLSLEFYTHFTSPIRRYSDLVIHRLLFMNDYEPDLDIVAQHCSSRERVSFRAEMGVLRLKKLRYLDRLTEEDSERDFNATVTGIKPQGLTFDVDFLGYEGFIHISALCDDYLHYNEKLSTLTGSKTKANFFLGQKLSVHLQTIDLVFQETSWKVIDTLSE